MADTFKTSGITADTPKNIFFGAGVIYKGLKKSESGWDLTAAKILGATQGGSKVTIAPEVKDIEVDGALVKVEELAVKTGETATMEINMLEVTPEILKLVTYGKDGTTVGEYSEIVSKARIEKGDYIENLAYVGSTLEGKHIIVLFESAKCSSGLDLEGKNKENGVIKVTFECYQKIDGDHTILPWHISYPTPVSG
ncbi:MAG: hypothetical protein ACI4NM_10795 [Bullifex sp.]